MDTYSDIGRERFERKRNVIYAEGVSSSFVRWWIRFSLPRRKECIMTRDGREIDIRCEMKEYLLYLMSKYFSRVIIHRRSFFVFFFFFLYIYIQATPNSSNNRTQSLPTWYARVLCILFESTTQQIEVYESVRNSRGKRKRVSDIYRVILFVCNRV